MKWGTVCAAILAVSIVSAHAADEPGMRLERWCADLKDTFSRLEWKLDPCAGLDWREGGVSIEGRALVYAEMGNPQATNTTLVFATVHGDEVTPLYLGIQLAHWLQRKPELLANTRVVLAPLVNPDGFFRHPRTRVNARGVDINRNFNTSDWKKAALSAWRKRFRSDPRRFPGDKPASEPETVFQERLIHQIKPQKVLSIHAPLNVLDYDGPSVLALSKFPSEYVKECVELRQRLKAKSTGFFPGSLGNYAGQELGIPTLTLELPSADSRRARRYWLQFSTGIRTMIEFTVPNYVSIKLDRSGS